MKLEDCKVGMEVSLKPGKIPSTKRRVEKEFPALRGKIVAIDFEQPGEEINIDGAWNLSSDQIESLEKTRHGHPRFYELLDSLADLHSQKNHDYAAGGNPLGNFARRAELYNRYPNLDLSDPPVVALVDAMKQLDAALWMYSNKHSAQVEGKIARLRDVAVYAILAIVMEEEKNRGESAEG